MREFLNAPRPGPLQYLVKFFRTAASRAPPVSVVSNETTNYKKSVVRAPPKISFETTRADWYSPLLKQKSRRKGLIRFCEIVAMEADFAGRG